MSKLIFVCSFAILASAAVAQRMAASAAFKIIPLGVKGGSDESNLSCYMVAPAKSDSYVCFDAGTLHYGLQKSVQAHIFKTSAASVLRNNIKGYLISHAHLDHISGLIINSPDDTVKNIYGTDFCLDILKDKYFTWKSWANFANEGDKPALKKYTYTYITNDKETNIKNTEMQVKAFTLSHSNPYQSTAFLVRNDSSYLLYLGDTGADEIEKSDKLHLLWQEVAPLIQSKKLKGIFIEVSFPDQQTAGQLYGHLTPKLLIQEMENLAALTGAEAMKNFNVLITHIKPAGNHQAQIKQQLSQQNKLKLNLIFPQQAHILKL